MGSYYKLQKALRASIFLFSFTPYVVIAQVQTLVLSGQNVVDASVHRDTRLSAYLLHQPVGRSLLHGLYFVVHLQLLVNVFDMFAYRALADEQVATDGLVGQSVFQLFQNFAFARC